MLTAAIPLRVQPAWLRSMRFDLMLILGVAALALTAGLTAAYSPQWLGLVVTLDLWLLGFHHVISTFTRLCFDRQSVRQHRFLLFGLPPLVLATVTALVLGVGAWLVVTIYFYWQWFHYARQSYGISRAYRHAAGGSLPESEWLSAAVIYLPATWGILSRSAQNATSFLGLPLHLIPVPELLVNIAGVASVAVVVAWLWKRFLAAWRSAMPMAQTLYVLSHVAIFYVGYVVIDDVTAGWLVANVWHNAQYILFVWWFNNRRFEGRSQPQARFLSLISQRRNIVLYVGVCLAISTLIYTAIASALPYVQLPALAAAAIAYQTINFHHYIVDAVIWRRGKPAAPPRRGRCLTTSGATRPSEAVPEHEERLLHQQVQQYRYPEGQ
jgi:hypothetical protein